MLAHEGKLCSLVYWSQNIISYSRRRINLKSKFPLRDFCTVL